MKRVTLGKVRKKMSLYDLKLDGYNALRRPSFVLSTGRCRTHWLTNVLMDHDKVFVEHQPEIPFLKEGKLVYENYGNPDNELLLEQIVCTARDHLWLECAKRNLRYIETNNRITFAVPILRKVLPHSKFLHLVRHPVDFIRSGLNRGWYSGSSHDLGRIVLKDEEIWDSLNLIQKIGWLWLETNKYILEHTKDLDEQRVLRMPSELMDIKRIQDVFLFLELNPDKISKSWFGKRTNAQTNRLEVSNEEIMQSLQKSQFFDNTKEMASMFGYSI